MAISPRDIIMTVIGFLLVALMTPIGANYLFSTNSTFNVTGTAATYNSVYTMFNVLLPVLYIVAAALYFVPKIGKD